MGFVDNHLESPATVAMQLKDLESFRVVAELGNLHSAADLLGVTQPALSKAVQRLEGSLGVRLFERTPRGVALTTIGRALYAKQLALARMVRDIRNEVRDLKTGESGELRIGTVPAVVESVVTPVLASFLGSARQIRFHAQVQLSGVLLHQLETGALDFAIAAVQAQTPAALSCLLLGEQQSFVVARKGHPLHRRAFTVEDMAAQPWVLPPANIALRAWVESMFAQAGIEMPAAFLQTDASPAVFASLVRGSNLLTVMTADSLSAGTGTGLAPLAAPAPVWTLQIGLFWRRNAYFSSPMEAFRDKVAEVFRARDAQLHRRLGRGRPGAEG
ncbi:LysR family transcriptional regulator [Xenophilus arseniciresistens]|uniref:LysR family transcriptional regulator n=1 Tax=Xenophilus arseniciresistens TaxID=1283306 RepID=A0AAE3N5Q3_9BURK|nr:LysR family transcriptional regulator [Xenophilus arseniciresistens]MDA7416385.1 LysR family transcriptional regulator [Xenophilus arseniciresistens]